LRPEMIIQSGISSPSLTRRVRCFFQNELLTSQLSRRCCAARALMIRLLLNLLTRMFRNSACFSADITWSGLGENHSLGGVFVHRGLVSASINNLCREFLGVGERNEWTVTPPCRSKRKHSGKTWTARRNRLLEETHSKLLRHSYQSTGPRARPDSRPCTP